MVQELPQILSFLEVYTSDMPGLSCTEASTSYMPGLSCAEASTSDMPGLPCTEELLGTQKMFCIAIATTNVTRL